MWFDLPLIFPKGIAGSAQARKRLEMQAKEKLIQDAKDAGYEAIEDSFLVTWISPYQASATLFAVKVTK